MKRFCWLLSCLLFVSTFAYPQQILKDRTIEWKHPRSFHYRLDEHHRLSGRYFYFEGARYFDHSTRLPYYYELIPVSAQGAYRVRMKNAEYKKLEGGVELPREARRQITDSVVVQVQKSFERSRPFLQLQFVPVRRHPVSGELQGLVRFDLEIVQTGSRRKSTVPSMQSAETPSVLRQGRWVQLRIDRDGIYRISHSRLEELGFEDPSRVRLYGNSSGLLEVGNDTTPDYRLHEIPVSFDKGSDGIFGNGDHLYFYGEDPHLWRYDQQAGFFRQKRHIYTQVSYYYLTSGQASVMEAIEQPAGPAEEVVSTFPDYLHHEQDERNLIQSGQHFFGEYFDVRTTRSFDFDFPNIRTDQPVSVEMNFVSRSAASSSAVVSYHDQQVLEVDIAPVSYNFTGFYARSGRGQGQFLPQEELVSLRVDYQKGTPSAEGWLDYITVNATRQLKMGDDQLQFRHRASGTGEVVALNISGARQGMRIWEVTDPRSVREVSQWEQEEDTRRFRILGDTTFREFIAFYPEKAPAPDFLGEVEPQNLHGMEPKDMMIVTKESFLSQAERLADVHRRRQGFKVGIATDQQIYNEFSSGKPDPAAIRNFLRILYRKSTPEDSLKYVLMLGDGSYDNHNSGESPFLMTYQSRQSLHYARSFVSDDFFGLLDEGDHVERSPSGLIDLGIGRFPVQEVSEAEALIDKVERYMDPSHWGPWLNKVCFVADDEDNSLHMRDADKLASAVADQHPDFNLEKIYFDAYKQEITATGARYPEVSRQINEQINNGILLFNYTGHGGERHLAHERVLTREDIRSWSNNDRLPLFMTATCEFTRFDDPNLLSAGEEVFLKPDGGSIASFSTTRLVYASLNYDLNRTFYDHVFKRDANGEPLRLGDVVRLTKNQAGSSNNKRNFSLFGDPALQMPLGSYHVQVDSILPADTLKALEEVTMHGRVVRADGSPATDFSGSMHVRFFDKPREIQTLNNDGQGSFQFQVRDNLLFSGSAPVQEGTFSSQWIVPRDILSGVAPGKMLFWGQSQSKLAQGFNSDHLVGGFGDNPLNDQQGPAIELFMNDRNFVSGGITNENPTLIAALSDSSGINTSRSGVGHDITMILDGDTRQQYVLNKYYQAREGSYRNGELRYQLSDLEKGKHELTLKAWDINNNLSSTTLEFTVSESDDLKISKVLNYPNPFTEQTAFYFEHNRPGTLLDVMVRVLTVSGKVVRSIHTQVQSDGFRAGPIPWNGKDDFGDRIGRGVYIYQLKVRSASGETAEKIEKLVILK
jgi:hypothetical protein